MSMLKYVLALLALVVVPLAPVSADEGYIPFFPDFLEPIGLKLRVSSIQTFVDIYFQSPDGSKQNVLSSRDPLYSNEEKTKQATNFSYPFTLEFEENLMNAWSYRTAFFEYIPNLSLTDLPPDSNGEIEDSGFEHLMSKLKNFRQNSDTRRKLLDHFFNSSDKEFTNANSQWALTADIEADIYMIGHYWGVFLPTKERNPTHNLKIKFFKLGFGFGLFHADIKIDYSLCSKHEAFTEAYMASPRCHDKTNIETIEAKVNGGILASSIYLFEIRSKNKVRNKGSAFIRFFGVEMFETFLNIDKSSGKKVFAFQKHDNYFTPKFTFTRSTFLEFSILF